MRARVAAWLRWLANQVDTHEHIWEGGVTGAVFGQMTCQECGYTELWQGRTHDGEPRDVIRGYRERMPGGATDTYRRVGSSV